MSEKTCESSGAPNSTFTGGGWKSHRILLVLFLLYLSDYADRYVVSGMVQFIKKDWLITDAQAGWLMGIVLLFITVFSLPASILIDRWSRRKMIAIMTGLWSVATLTCAAANSFTQLLIARAFIGIGESGYAPAGTALLSAAYPEQKRGRVMGIWNIAIPFGVALGMIGGGIIARNYGWQHAFGLVSIPGFILAIAAWFLPDYQTVAAQPNHNSDIQDTGARVPTPAHSSAHSPTHALKLFFSQSLTLFKIPSLAFTYLGFAMNVAVTTSLMHWLPTYFERAGLAEPGKGGAATMPIFGLVLLGAPLGGIISDQWAKKRPEARLIFPAITSLLAAAALALGFIFIGTRAQLPFLVSYGILITCFVAPAAAVTQDVVHPGLRAVSYALCVIVQHLAGDIWSPPLVGWLSDRLDLGLPAALLVVPLWAALAALCFRIASRFYLKDLERVEKIVIAAEG